MAIDRVFRSLAGIICQIQVSASVRQQRKKNNITVTIEALSIIEREKKKLMMRLEYNKSRRKDNGRQQQSLVSLARCCPYRTLSIFAIYLPAVCNEDECKEIYTTTRY